MDIDQILSLHKPHIFSLCEANIDRITNDTHNNNYLDYNIEHTKMSAETNQSRNAILIKNDIIYNRRHDLEDEITSTIWLEVKLPQSKPILISSIYRQWSLPKILGITNSNNIHNQTVAGSQLSHNGTKHIKKTRR